MISHTLHNADGTKSHQTLLLVCLHQNQRQNSMSLSLTWIDEERRVQRRNTKHKTQHLQKV